MWGSKCMKYTTGSWKLLRKRHLWFSDSSHKSILKSYHTSKVFPLLLRIKIRVRWVMVNIFSTHAFTFRNIWIFPPLQQIQMEGEFFRKNLKLPLPPKKKEEKGTPFDTLTNQLGPGWFVAKTCHQPFLQPELDGTSVGVIPPWKPT